VILVIHTSYVVGYNACKNLANQFSQHLLAILFGTVNPKIKQCEYFKPAKVHAITYSTLAHAIHSLCIPSDPLVGNLCPFYCEEFNSAVCIKDKEGQKIREVVSYNWPVISHSLPSSLSLFLSFSHRLLK